MVRRTARILGVALAGVLALGGVPSGQDRPAGAGDTIRLIVRLNVPFAPEGTMGAAAVSAQRGAIARAEAAALAGPAGAFIRSSHPFQTVPYAVMEVSASALGLLAAQPVIAGFTADRVGSASLAQSTALIGSTATVSAGHRGSGWNVAVLDTGVERGHPFFGGRVVSEACYSSNFTGRSETVCPNGLTSQTGTGAGAPCTFRGCDHGTHVAGIAAGSSGSSGGATFDGVAPSAGIIAVQVFSRFIASEDCGGAPPCARYWTSDQMRGLERAYLLRSTFNIAAVNMSLVENLYSSAATCDAENNGRKALIDNLRSEGIATVVSSGNDGSSFQLTAPACISSTVSVGSTLDNALTVSSFSNSASFLTLLAPGSNITSSVPGSGYAVFNGTSMAAPHVAGAWAVLKAASPFASVSSVLNALVDTGTAVTDPRNGVTKSLIQLPGAMSALPSCTYNINPSSLSAGANATSGSTALTTQAGCPWTASTQTSFLTLTSASSGSGPAGITFNVGANGSPSPRTGTATIAGHTFTVTQAAAPTLRMAPDVNNDGHVDLIWQNRTEGYLAAWMMNGLNLSSSDLFSPSRVTDPNWRIAATADMDGDGKMDLIWQEETQGWIGIWKMNGLNLVSSLAISVERVPDTGWKIVAAQDFNADGKADIVWHHRTQGYIALWYMDGVTVTASELFSPGRVADSNWQVEAAADFNSDGKPDLLWRHQTQGWITVWLMNGLNLTGGRDLSPSRVADTSWRIASVADVNRDNMPDLVWHDTVNGWIGVWLMNGTSLLQSVAFTPERVPDVKWRIVGPK